MRFLCFPSAVLFPDRGWQSLLAHSAPVSPARGNDGEVCLCVMGVGAEDTGTVSAELCAIGCCRPVLHMGSDMLRLVHLPSSCGHSQSF